MSVWNPLSNLTRPETFDFLKPLDALDLLSLTHSCAHPRGQTKMQPHCGICSQCVDRRFGTMAADLDEYDLVEAYRVDIFRHALEDGEPRTIGTAYFRHALRLDGLSEDQIVLEYPQLNDCLDSSSPTVAEDGLAVVRMHRRHAAAVIRVMSSQIAANADAIARGLLPPTCLINLCSLPHNGPELHRGRRPGLLHSDDYASIVFRGASHAPRPMQRLVIRLLNETWEKREPPLSWSAITERTGCESPSMSDLFRKSPLWKTLASFQAPSYLAS